MNYSTSGRAYILLRPKLPVTFDLRGEGWEDLSPDRVTLRRFVTPKTLA